MKNLLSFSAWIKKGKENMRKRRMQTIGSNAIDGASSSLYWGKKRCKLYKDVAGKGGNTTNGTIFSKEDGKDA